jgi:hypothetical protein
MPAVLTRWDGKGFASLVVTGPTFEADAHDIEAKLRMNGYIVMLYNSTMGESAQVCVYGKRKQTVAALRDVCALLGVEITEDRISR